MTEAANELLDIYATPDSTGVENDSLRWVWQQIPTVAARYAEALLRVQADDFTGAQAPMDDLDEDHRLSTAEETERARMGSLIADMLNLAQQARDVRQLDTGEVAAWETLNQDQYDRSLLRICLIKAPNSGSPPASSSPSTGQSHLKRC